jgi:hypothetical protein
MAPTARAERAKKAAKKRGTEGVAMGTRTLLVDIGKLSRRGEEGAIVVGLMIAFNDLTMANVAQRLYNEDTSRYTNYDSGAGIYFARIQMAHLVEALDLVKAVDRNATLSTLVAQCPDPTANHFAELLSYASGGYQRRIFADRFKTLRHTIAFHYDLGDVKDALSERSQRRGDVAHLICEADDIRLAHFQLADDIVDTLVCTRAWKLAPGPNLPEDANDVLSFGFEIYTHFIRFVGAFVRVYIENNALWTR